MQKDSGSEDFLSLPVEVKIDLVKIDQLVQTSGIVKKRKEDRLL